MTQQNNDPTLIHERTKHAAWTFAGLNTLGLGMSGGIENLSPNVMSLSQFAMSAYDWVLSGGMWVTDRFDRAERYVVARTLRAGLALGHIAVAVYGTVVAANRVQTGTDIGTPGSVLASGGVAALSVGAAVFERYRSRNTEVAEVPLSQMNGHNFVHRLLGTKAFEATAGLLGAVGQFTTHDPRFSLGATVVTTGAVGWLMARQVKDELMPEHVRRIGPVTSDYSL